MTEEVLSRGLRPLTETPGVKQESTTGFKFYLFDDNFPMVYQEPKINCDGCAAPCCVKFSVPLTPRESRYLPLDQDEIKNGIHYLDKKPEKPCPFLINSKCSIWDIRPVVCREYSCEGDSRCSRTV